MSQPATPRCVLLAPAPFQCVVALSGADVAVTVPPLPHPATSADVALALQHQFGAPAGQLYLFADSGAALAAADAPAPGAPVVVFCDLALLHFFGAGDGAAPAARLRRQRMALGLLPSPAAAHAALLRRDLAATEQRLAQVGAQLTALVAALPAALARLEAVPLIQDPARMLHEHMCAGHDWRGITALAHDALRDAGADVARVRAAVPGLEADVAALAAPLPAAAAQAAPDAVVVQLRATLQERFAGLLRCLKHTAAQRRLLQGAATACRAVHHNFAKLKLLPSLPEAYADARALCDRRLVLFRAVQRVHARLAEELDGTREATAAFVAEWGERFPRGLIPGIEDPPRVPRPVDAAAAFLQQACPAPGDDDAASALLERLQLGGSRGEVAALRARLAAGAEAEARLEAELEAERSSSAALAAELAAARAALAAAPLSLHDAAAARSDPEALCAAVFAALFAADDHVTFEPLPPLPAAAAGGRGGGPALALRPAAAQLGAVVRGVLVVPGEGSAPPPEGGRSATLNVVSVLQVEPRLNCVLVLTALPCSDTI